MTFEGYSTMDDILSLALEQSGVDNLIPDLVNTYFPTVVDSFQASNTQTIGHVLQSTTTSSLTTNEQMVLDTNTTSKYGVMSSSIDDDLSALLNSTSTDYLNYSLPVVPSSSRSNAGTSSMDVNEVLMQLGLDLNDSTPSGVPHQLLTTNAIPPSTNMIPVNNDLRFVSF